MQNKIYTIKNTKKLPDCITEITAEIENDALETYKEKALKKIREATELPGFRKGQVPMQMIKEKVGELGLIEEAGELAINDAVLGIITETKTNFLGRPEVAITKIAPGSPLEFKVKLMTMPEAQLADYKKIAKKINSAPEKIDEVTEKQLEETINEIRTMYARQTAEKSEENPALPELTDELVKKLGAFKDVADFKEKLKINIAEEKKIKAKNKRVLEIIDTIINDSKIEMPKALIENELDKMESQFKGDIANMGLQPDEYLKHIKKSWDDLRKEWIPDAEKRAQMQIILQKISLEEKLEPKKEDIEKEVKHLLEHYKDASEERARAYVEMQLSNEMVVKFLEEQK